MKALRSPLAQRVLADPKARTQLRGYLGSSIPGEKPEASPKIELRAGGKTLVYQPVVVPKA